VKSDIAYIDDDRLNLECIQAVFEDDFYVQIFDQPQVFLDSFSLKTFTCLLLDIHMPLIDGFALYEKIISHPKYNGCPIFFISSDESDTARIKSLTLGAVDFIGRLMSPDEMIARVKSKIQFFENHRSVIEFDRVKINLTQLKTSLDEKELPLTFIELKILLLVVKNFPDAVPKDTLVDQIWKGAIVQDATIHTHVFNLNTKLQSWTYEAQTVKGKGVQLVKKVGKR
jgi:DNA-binding response OmpR family regulator